MLLTDPPHNPFSTASTHFGHLAGPIPQRSTSAAARCAILFGIAKDASIANSLPTRSRMRRREFITLLGGAAALAARGARAAGRAGAAHRRAHARSRGRCGISGPHRGVPAGAGRIGLDRSAATCGSTRAGPRPMPTTFADTRRNWPRSRRTSSWPLAPRPWRRCYRRPAPCRSCSRCRRSGRRRFRR